MYGRERHRKILDEVWKVMRPFNDKCSRRRDQAAVSKQFTRSDYQRSYYMEWFTGKFSRSKNVERAGGGPKPGIPVDLMPGGKDRAAGPSSAVPGKRGKANTKGALELVQQSTASMGK